MVGLRAHGGVVMAGAGAKVIDTVEFAVEILCAERYGMTMTPYLYANFNSLVFNLGRKQWVFREPQ